MLFPRCLSMLTTHHSPQAAAPAAVRQPPILTESPFADHGGSRSGTKYRCGPFSLEGHPTTTSQERGQGASPLRLSLSHLSLRGPTGNVSACGYPHCYLCRPFVPQLISDPLRGNPGLFRPRSPRDSLQQNTGRSDLLPATPSNSDSTAVMIMPCELILRSIACGPVTS